MDGLFHDTDVDQDFWMCRYISVRRIGPYMLGVAASAVLEFQGVLKTFQNILKSLKDS